MADIVQSIEALEPEKIDISVDGFGPWSISKAKTGRQCPLKFYLQYIIKLKHGVPVYSLVTDVGKAAHRILEHVIVGKTVTESFALARKEYTHIPEDDWQSRVATMEYNIIEFRQKLDKFEQNHPIRRFVQELKVGMTRDYRPTGFFGKDVFFRGVIDFGMQTEDNDIVIIDHKTGAPSITGIRNFKTQLDTYKVLFHHAVQPIEGAQAGIHFIKDGKIILDDYTPKNEIESKLIKELEFYLNGVIDRIKEIGYFKHIRGPYCEWCDFNEPCKEGKLVDIEKKTIRFFKKNDTQIA